MTISVNTLSTQPFSIYNYIIMATKHCSIIIIIFQWRRMKQELDGKRYTLGSDCIIIVSTAHCKYYNRVYREHLEAAEAVIYHLQLYHAKME